MQVKESLTLGSIFFAIVFLAIKFLSLDTLEFVLEKHWQFLDLAELARAPFQSLLYQHSQPPLLNFVAWLLMFLPNHLYTNFVILNAMCVAIAGVVIFAIARHYVAKAWALFLALLYIVSPVALLNSAYPFYPCLTTLGYALLLYSFFAAPRKLWLFVFAITYLALLRSSFSLLHTVFFCVVFYWYNGGKIAPKKLVTAFCIALCFGAAVPVKNYVLYGFFGSSSWAPLNIAQGVGIPNILGYFPSPQKIKQAHPEMRCAHSYGVQDTGLTKQNGQPNYNSCYVIEYAKIVKAEIAKNYQIPNHLHNFLGGSVQYFSPPDTYNFLKNRPAIEGYANAAGALQGTVALTPLHHVRLLLLLLLLSSGVVAIKTKDKFLIVCLIVFVVHFFSHALTDGGEGKRFVFDIEFLFYVLVGIVAASIKKSWIKPQFRFNNDSNH